MRLSKSISPAALTPSRSHIERGFPSTLVNASSFFLSDSSTSFAFLFACSFSLLSFRICSSFCFAFLLYFRSSSSFCFTFLLSFMKTSRISGDILSKVTPSFHPFFTKFLHNLAIVLFNKLDVFFVQIIPTILLQGRLLPYLQRVPFNWIFLGRQNFFKQQQKSI